MISSGQVVVQAAKFLFEGKFSPLNIVEIGTINGLGFNYALHSGYSTFHVADWIKRSGISHKFYSLELSDQSLDFSRRVLEFEHLSGFVSFHRGDASGSLSKMREASLRVDLAYIDGASCPAQALDQFYILETMMERPAIVLVDDVYERPEENKGELIEKYVDHKKWRREKIVGRLMAVSFGADPVLERLALLEIA